MPKTAQDQNYPQKTTPVTEYEKHGLNFKKILVPLLIIITLTLVILGSFYVKNLKTVLGRVEKPSETSAAEYLRLDFSYENGQLKYIKAANIDVHPTTQPARPEDGFEITVESSNQASYQTYMHKKQSPLFAVIPTEGDEILVKETKSGSQIMNLNLPEVRQSATKERDYANPQVNIFLASWRLTTFDIKRVFADKVQNKNEENLNPLPQEAQKLVADVSEAKIIAANSEMVVWYFPQTQEFSVIILSEDLEGVRKRAYDWFRAYGVTNQDSAKINFTLSSQAP